LRNRDRKINRESEKEGKEKKRERQTSRNNFYIQKDLADNPQYRERETKESKV
jgi:hypothetical protein